MFKRLVSAIVMAFLVHATVPAVSGAADKAAAPAKPTPPLVKVDKGRVSVEAKDAVLADLLNAIGKQAGVQVTIKSGGEDRVTQSFSNLGLDDAIQLLGKGKDLVLVYSSAKNLAGTNLAEVRLFAASAPGGRVVSEGSRGAQPPAVKTPAGQPHDLQTVPSLVNQLTDKDVEVRREASAALANRQDQEAVEALRTAVEDQDAMVRANALAGLGILRDEDSVGTMSQALLRDPDMNVRRTAINALSLLRTESARRAIEAAESDADPAVRQAAANVLRQWKSLPGAK